MITEVVNLVGDGAGDWEKRGREVYGRPKKRGREAGEGQGEGGRGKQEKKETKIMQHCAISLSTKKCKVEEANKYRAGTGIKGYGSRRFKLPLSPPPPPII